LPNVLKHRLISNRQPWSTRHTRFLVVFGLLWTRSIANFQYLDTGHRAFICHHLMSNLLALPFKKSAVIPVSQAARKYVQDNLPDSNPDAFKWDFKEWARLRKQTLSDVIHVDLIQPFLECVASPGTNSVIVNFYLATTLSWCLS
jgi:hypothetical protein